MRRKLFCVSLFLVLGVWTTGISGLAAAGLIVAAFFYAAVLYVQPEYDVCKLKGLALACAAALAVGAVRMILQQNLYGSFAPEKSKFTAEVLKVSLKKDKSPKLTVRIKGSGRKCLLSYYGNNNDYSLRMLTGALIRFSGETEEPETAGNPRCFDYRTYLRSQGISCISSSSVIKVVRKDAGPAGALRRKILIFREGFIRALCKKPDGGTGTGQTEALLRGILFGDTDSMDEDMKEDFRRNGTAHILAVSGLHIGLLYSIFRMLRKKTAIPGMTGAFLAVLIIYGTMTLWTVSVTRAVALIILIELGEKLDRPFDLLTSLGFVSMLVLMHEPYALYGTSFMMSYLAALSIGVICPALKRVVPDRLPESVKTSLSVQVGLVPFIAYSFNMIPVGALIINIPVILLLTVIVTVSAAAVPAFIVISVVDLLSSIVAGHPMTDSTGSSSASAVSLIIGPLKMIISFLGNLLIILNERFADIELLSPDVVSPPLFIVAAYYGIVFLLCSESFRVAKMRKDLKLAAPQIGITMVVILIACVMSVSEFDKADVIMVDVGQGDCMHFRFYNYIEPGHKGKQTGVRIQLPGYTDVLIDGGGNEEYNIGKKTLKPYLLKNGIRHVDLALATHLHTDHYKGIEELAEEGMVKQVVTEGRTGDIIDTGSGRIEIIWPDVQDKNTDDENKNSLIFKVHIDGITVLITGDLGEEGEHALVERYKGTGVLDCDVLKVCHHGSKTSSSSEFIEAVSPGIALIGVGKNNMYGHPTKEAIDRLEACGARVFRTDNDGAIGIIKTKKGIEVCRMRP